MKSRSLIFCCVASILLAAYFCLSNLPYPSVDKEKWSDELAEHANQVKNELDMLADPRTGRIPQGARIKELSFLLQLQQEQLSNNARRRSASWSSRGPWNVGGRTRAMAIDKTNENHLLAGGVSGGIWQSMDGGNTWNRVSDANGHPGVVSITQDSRPGKTNIWYALSGEITGTSASGSGRNSFYLGDGAFKSLNNGTTWTPIASTASGMPSSFTSNFQGAWRILSSPLDTPNTNLYMATYGSIYRSTDTGKTWKIVIGNGNDSYYTDLQISKSGVVYAAFSSDGNNTKGIFRSANGVQFTKISPPFLQNADRMVLEINPNNENEVYFLGELPDSNGGVTTANYEGRKEYVCLYKYTYLHGDGTGSGGLWENLSTNLPVNASSPFDRFNCQGGYDLFVRMQPGSNTLFIGGTNIYRSTDAFATSNNIQQIGGYGISTVLPFFTVYPNHHPDQHDLIFLPSDPQKAYNVCDGGVYFTDNIMSPVVEWQSKNNGYLTSQFYTINIDESTAFSPWLLGGLQDNGNYISASRNPQHAWYLPFNGDGSYSYIAPNRDFYVMSTQLGRMVKFELNQHGYVVARRRIDPEGYKKEDYNFIHPFIVDPNDNNIMYTPIGKRIARLNSLRDLPLNNDTARLKNSWTIFSDTIKTPTYSDGAISEISALAISKNDPNILYFGTNNKEMFRVDNANTGNPSYVLLDTASKRLPVGGYVSDIAVDPDSAKNVLICYSNYGIFSLFYTNDFGNNWYFVGGNLEFGAKNPTGADPSIRSVNILVDKNGKRHYFAGTSIGLFSTDNLVLSTSAASAVNKTVWVQESPDQIGAAIVTDIKVRQADGYVVIATHGNGVYESYYTGELPPTSPTYFEEVTLYPNPTNDWLYCSFQANTTTNNEAEIYSMQGTRVAVCRGINYNGITTIKTNVSHLPSGHYFMTFNTSQRRKQTKHFIVHH
jgi:hypothetical protein